ncbi:terpenoid synthase [Pleurotus eryngii]|uniref:Terpene synthase n=1 Tax=Pleurotus eryngii TaxID=5323 RepID=A0A9P6A3X7_PLEER|nr:terpenoid synthase [Pleurotus eryngii]
MSSTWKNENGSLQSDKIALDDEGATSVEVQLPRILDGWPWPHRANLHYGSVKQQASSWCESFHAFDPRAQDAFNKCNLTRYRVACDFFSLVFAIDEHTDLATANVARSQASIIMDTIRNPNKPRPSDEWVIGEMARQFWANAILVATPTAFVDNCQTYLDAVVQQAEDRAQRRVRSLEDYLEVRRDSAGVKISFAIGELHLHVPQEVIDHPPLAANDIYSYKVEWERGDGAHNLVTVVIHQFGMDVQDAMNYIGNLNDYLVEEFLAQRDHIPIFGGPVDLEIRAYCDMLGEWIRGNDSWSFEGGRYFGEEGPKIQNTRVVCLTSCRGEKSTS